MALCVCSTTVVSILLWYFWAPVAADRGDLGVEAAGTSPVTFSHFPFSSVFIYLVRGY